MSQKERGKKTLLNTNISKVRFRTQSNSSVYYKDTAWHKSCKYACLNKCLVCKKRTKSLAKPGLWSEDCRSHRHFYARVLHLVCHVKMCACTNVCVFVRVLAGGGDRKASKWKPSQWTIRAAAAAGLTGRLWLVRVTLWWRGGVKKKKKKKLSRARGKAAGWTCAVCQRQPVLKGSECAHISPSACGEISSRKRSFCASDNKQQQQQSVCARARVCVRSLEGGPDPSRVFWWLSERFVKCPHWQSRRHRAYTWVFSPSTGAGTLMPTWLIDTLWLLHSYSPISPLSKTAGNRESGAAAASTLSDAAKRRESAWSGLLSARAVTGGRGDPLLRTFTTIRGVKYFHWNLGQIVFWEVKAARRSWHRPLHIPLPGWTEIRTEIPALPPRLKWVSFTGRS